MTATTLSTIDLYLIQKPSNFEAALYKGQVDIARKQGHATRVSALVPLSGTLDGLLKTGEFSLNRLAWSPLGLLAYPKVAGSYTILDTKTGKENQIKVDSANAANPQFSADGKWLSLEVLNSKALTITTQIFSLTSNQVISLPAADKNTSQISLSFVGKNYVTWTEAIIQTSSSNHVLTLKGGLLSQLSAKGSAKLLLTDKNPRLKGIRVFTDSSGQNFAAISKEAYKEGDGVGGGKETVLARGEVFLAYFNQELTALSQESVAYHPRMMGLKKYFNTYGDGVLSRDLFFAANDQLIFSLGGAGGMVSLNVKTKTWNFHGTSDSIYRRCYFPVLGPEVTP
jgi:hypothetical protein